MKNKYSKPYMPAGSNMIYFLGFLRLIYPKWEWRCFNPQHFW